MRLGTMPGYVLAAVLAALVLAGCTDDDRGFTFPNPPDIDVDTKQLRSMKADAGVAPCAPGASPGANELPAVTLPCFGGGQDVDLSSLEGPLVLNFWASWCEPCREEMPALQEFHEKHGDRIAVIGVNRLDPQTKAAMELVRETGVTYPLLADPGDELSGKEPLGTMSAMPMFAFVDSDGSVTKEFDSVESLSEMETLVGKHLEGVL